MLDLRAGNCRGLTLYQPWAQAVALRLKKLETRSRKTNWRGYLLIHAGARKSGFLRRTIALAPAWAPLRAAGELRGYLMLPAAVVVAVARLDKCFHVPDAGWTDEDLAALRHVSGSVDELVRAAQDERACGDFSPGRYAWRLADLVVLERPVSCRGAQGLWYPPPQVLEEVRRQLPSSARERVPDLSDRIAP